MAVAARMFWVCLLLTSVAFAGCMSSPDDASLDGAGTDPSVPRDGGDMVVETKTDLELRFDPMAADNASDWFFMETATDADGEATGFVWDVPDDAAVTVQYSPRLYGVPLGAVLGGSSTDRIILEVVPVMPAGTESTQNGWGIMVFKETNGNAQMVGSFGRGPWSEYGSMYGGETASVATGYYEWVEDAEFWMQPFAFSMDPDRVGSGEVRLVLYSSSTAPGDFGVLFRVLDEAPQNANNPPSADVSGFLAAVDADRPVGLRALGTAPSAYTESYYYYEGTGYRYEGQTPNIDVRKSAPHPSNSPAPVQQWSVNAEDDSARGWSYGYAWFGHFSGAGQYDVGFDARGVAQQTSGEAASYMVTGDYSGFEFIAEGEGTASVNADIAFAGPDMIDEGVVVHLGGLGAPLEEIIGYPAHTFTLWSDAFNPGAGIGAHPFGPHADPSMGPFAAS